MTFVPELAVREMGSGQSSGEGEREVTVEERAGEDGPQIIVREEL